MEASIKDLCIRVNEVIQNAPDPKSPHEAQLFLRELTVVLASLPELIYVTKKEMLLERKASMESEYFREYKKEFGNALAAKYLETLNADKQAEIFLLEETYRAISKSCDAYRSILSYEKEEMRFNHIQA